VFAESDLELLQLRAGVAAAVRDSRALLQEVAGARLRAEADGLKHGSLGSISQGLRNPLTPVGTHPQLLPRASSFLDASSAGPG
jgi:K+-sensing histidine kinase KdpD